MILVDCNGERRGCVSGELTGSTNWLLLLLLGYITSRLLYFDLQTGELLFDVTESDFDYIHPN